jgi:hypothetical protein
MSRYRFVNTTKEPGKRYEVAYGFDRPMQEYFLQVFDLNVPEAGNNNDDDDDDVHCIVWEGNRMTGKSNSEMLELFELWGVPETHLQQVALDLPF